MSARNKHELGISVAIVPSDVTLHEGEPMPAEVPRIEVIEPVSVESQEMIDAVRSLPDKYVPIIVVPPPKDEKGNDVEYDEDSRPVAKTQLFGIASDIHGELDDAHVHGDIVDYKPEITTPDGEDPGVFVARSMAVVAFVSGQEQPIVQRVVELEL